MAGIFAIYFLKLYESGLLTSLLIESTIQPFRDYYELVGEEAKFVRMDASEGSHSAVDRVEAGKSKYLLEQDTATELMVIDPNVSVFRPLQEALKVTPLLKTP